MAKRLLINWGYDPDEVKEDSPIWAKAQKQAIECISGGTGIMPGSDDLSLDGIEMHRADPAEWGPSPYEEDAFRVDDEDDAEELEEQWGPM